MGKELMIHYPPVLDNIRSMDEILQDLEHAPTWSIEGITACVLGSTLTYHRADVIVNSGDTAMIGKAEYSQPICTALQIALVDLLATWSIVPSAVVGHSSGEIAASYAAGALTLKEAIIAAYYRGYVCKTPKRTGGMAAVGMGKNEVSTYLVQGVQLACENSVSNVTISGDLESLETVMSRIKEQNPDVLVRKLQVEMAYHSRESRFKHRFLSLTGGDHMTVVGESYRTFIAKHLSPSPPKYPFYSSVKCKALHEASDFGPQYWQDNLESPVLFHSAVRALLAGSKQSSVHLEVGPHAALGGPLRQIYNETSMPINYVPTLIRGKDDTDSFLAAVGQLYSLGVRVSYPSNSNNLQVLTDVPTYPWHYERSYWSETRIMKSWRFRKHGPHDLLGLRILEGSDVSPSWRNELRLADVSWLRDHIVGNDIVFPGAGYVAMAGEAIFQIEDVREYTVNNVELSKAMLLYNDKPVDIITSLRTQRLTSTLDSGWYEFDVVSYDGVAWKKNCSGLVRSGRATANPPRRYQTLDREVSSSRWYRTMSMVGLNYGPRFTGLKNITASILKNEAAADIMDKQESGESLYMLHPSTLDLIFQSVTVATCQGVYRKFKTLVIPTYIEELYVGNATRKAVQISTTAADKSSTFQGNSFGTSEGETVFYLKGFRGTTMEDSGTEKLQGLKSLQLQWKPHFDFLDARDLMKVKHDSREQIQHLERLYVLCAIESRNALSGVSTEQPHLEKYRAWLDQQFRLFQKPGYPLVEDSTSLTSMDEHDRRQLISKVFEECHALGSQAVATAIWRAYVQVVNVYEGRTDYLDL